MSIDNEPETGPALRDLLDRELEQLPEKLRPAGALLFRGQDQRTGGARTGLAAWFDVVPTGPRP